MQDMGIKILFEGDHLIRLLEGMGVTLRISLVSAGGSVTLGRQNIWAGIFQENRRPQRCLLSGERQKWGIWCAALCSLFPDIKGRAVRH